MLLGIASLIIVFSDWTMHSVAPCVLDSLLSEDSMPRWGLDQVLGDPGGAQLDSDQGSCESEDSRKCPRDVRDNRSSIPRIIFRMDVLLLPIVFFSNR